MFVKIGLGILALLACFFLFATAFATKSEFVLNEMDGKESAAYIAATVEGFAFMSFLNGKSEINNCITKWYFETEETPEFVVNILAKYPDKTPQEVIFVLIRRECGDPRVTAN